MVHHRDAIDEVSNAPCDHRAGGNDAPTTLQAALRPFGHGTQLHVFVDPDLLQCGEVWAATGMRNDNFGAAPADLVRVAGGVVADLKRD